MDLVEKMARAICCPTKAGCEVAFRNRREPDRMPLPCNAINCMELSRSVLSCIEEEGMVVVPRDELERLRESEPAPAPAGPPYA
jgi:hypothetical protein